MGFHREDLTKIWEMFRGRLNLALTLHELGECERAVHETGSEPNPEALSALKKFFGDEKTVNFYSNWAKKEDVTVCANVLNDAVYKIPQDQLIEFTEFLRKNKTVEVLTQKEPETMAIALKILMGRSNPEDRPKLMEDLDRKILPMVADRSRYEMTARIFTESVKGLAPDQVQDVLSRARIFRELLTAKPDFINSFSDDTNPELISYGNAMKSEQSGQYGAPGAYR